MTADQHEGREYLAVTVEVLTTAVAVGFVLVLLTGVLDGLGYQADQSVYGYLLIFGSLIIAAILVAADRQFDGSGDE